MPKGTRVEKCVRKLEKKGVENPYGICSAATGQAYATGKPISKEARLRHKRMLKHKKKIKEDYKINGSFSNFFLEHMDKLI